MRESYSPWTEDLKRDGKKVAKSQQSRLRKNQEIVPVTGKKAAKKALNTAQTAP